MLARRGRLAVVALPVLLVGCGGSQPAAQQRYNYNYNYNYDQPVTVAVFKDEAPANARTAADSLPATLVDHTGKPVDLTAYRGKKNVVLVVMRGIPQSPGGVPCPYCAAQTNSLAANLANFRDRDAEVLVLFPGPTDLIGEFIKQAEPVKNALPFPLVLDRDLAVCDRLGIRGDLAKPSVYVLDKKGAVVYAYVGETRTDRPSIKAILGQLDKLQDGPPRSAPPTNPATRR